MEVSNSKRYHFLDFIRGLAVWLMVYFHFFYDLNQFQFVSINFQRDPFWFYLPRLIVTLFLFAVGLSMSISHKGPIRRRPYFKRLAKIGIGALIISFSTYFMFPKSWVYFGTLHCIFFCTILITPLRHRYLLSFIAACSILTLEVIGYDIPFWTMQHASMDYIPLFPWVAVCLLGICAKYLKVHQIPMPENKLTNLFIVPGKHAFIIYIIHQPILFSSVYLFHKIVSK